MIVDSCNPSDHVLLETHRLFVWKLPLQRQLSLEVHKIPGTQILTIIHMNYNLESLCNKVAALRRHRCLLSTQDFASLFGHTAVVAEGASELVELNLAAVVGRVGHER